MFTSPGPDRTRSTTRGRTAPAGSGASRSLRPCAKRSPRGRLPWSHLEAPASRRTNASPSPVPAARGEVPVPGGRALVERREMLRSDLRYRRRRRGEVVHEGDGDAEPPRERARVDDPGKVGRAAAPVDHRARDAEGGGGEAGPAAGEERVDDLPEPDVLRAREADRLDEPHAARARLEQSDVGLRAADVAGQQQDRPSRALAGRARGPRGRLGGPFRRAGAGRRDGSRRPRPARVRPARGPALARLHSFRHHRRSRVRS